MPPVSYIKKVENALGTRLKISVNPDFIPIDILSYRFPSSLFEHLYAVSACAKRTTVLL